MIFHRLIIKTIFGNIVSLGKELLDLRQIFYIGWMRNQFFFLD